MRQKFVRQSAFGSIYPLNSPSQKEKLFYIIACITIFFFSLAFAGTFFREEIHDVLRENIITDDKNSLSESKKQNIRTMNKATILKKSQPTIKSYSIFWVHIIIGMLFLGFLSDFSY